MFEELEEIGLLRDPQCKGIGLRDAAALILKEESEIGAMLGHWLKANSIKIHDQVPFELV